MIIKPNRCESYIATAQWPLNDVDAKELQAIKEDVKWLNANLIKVDKPNHRYRVRLMHRLGSKSPYRHLYSPWQGNCKKMHSVRVDIYVSTYERRKKHSW